MIFEHKGNKKLFIITNRKLVVKGDIYKAIKRCLCKGADAVILREKDLDEVHLKVLAEKVKYITDSYSIPLIVNGNFNIAVNIEAFGFHTGFEKFKEFIKDSSNKEKIINIKNNREFKLGVSVHSVDEALEVEALGADYILAGHVFETECKRGLKGRGIGFIENICSKVNIPVIALGGINNDNVDKIINTPVFGYAVMSEGMKINN